MTHSSQDPPPARNPLCEAAAMESEADAIQWSRELINAGEDPNDIRLESEFAPLELAWMYGYLELMKLLIGSGARADLELRLETVLFLPRVPIECSLLMFEYGFSFQDSLHIHKLSDSVSEKIFFELNPLYELLCKGCFEKIDSLRPHGIMDFLTVFDELGHAPLHSAVDENNIVLVKWMLKEGTDVNAHCESRIGSTALDIAVQESNLEIVKILIHAGANPNIPTWMWKTATDKACRISNAARKPGRDEQHRKELIEIKSLVLEAAKRFPKPKYPDGRSVDKWPPCS